MTSKLYRDERIIDDESPIDDGTTGLDLSERPNVDGYGYGATAEPFEDSLLIPESEWQAIIEEQEQRKTRVSDLVTAYRIPPKNQGSLNYCWIYAPVHAMELLRVRHGYGYRPLAAAQVGASIKRGRNVGGWGMEGVRWIGQHGIPYESDYSTKPEILRGYDSQSMQAKARANVLTEWVECRPKSVPQLVSMLLRGYCGAIGLPWWQHEVLAAEAVWLDGEIAIRIRNQWQGWGVNGFGILRGSKMVPNDCVFPVASGAAGGGP
jgi:hypothetical protein